MNLCFLLGKVISDIEFKFIYNSKNVSITIFYIMLKNKSIIKCKAYNEIADEIYRNIKKDNYIFIEGYLKNQYVQIYRIVKK